MVVNCVFDDQDKDTKALAANDRSQICQDGQERGS